MPTSPRATGPGERARRRRAPRGWPTVVRDERREQAHAVLAPRRLGHEPRRLALERHEQVAATAAARWYSGLVARRRGGRAACRASRPARRRARRRSSSSAVTAQGTPSSTSARGSPGNVCSGWRHSVSDAGLVQRLEQVQRAEPAASGWRAAARPRRARTAAPTRAGRPRRRSRRRGRSSHQASASRAASTTRTCRDGAGAEAGLLVLGWTPTADTVRPARSRAAMSVEPSRPGPITQKRTRRSSKPWPSWLRSAPRGRYRAGRRPVCTGGLSVSGTRLGAEP